MDLAQLQRDIGNRAVRSVLSAAPGNAAPVASVVAVQRKVWQEGGKNSVAIPASARAIAERARNMSSLLPGGSRHVPNAYLAHNGYRLGKVVYVGGDIYGNRPAADRSRLPVDDAPYREWDVHPLPAPLPPGFNRGRERVVTSASGVCYYTSDHYLNFTRFKV